MSQFTFFNDMKSALSMEGEMSRGPVPRWKKKMELSSVNTSGNISRSVLSTSCNLSFTGNNVLVKTPGKNTEVQDKRTPCRKNKPEIGGDRFIPNRSSSNFELAHYLIKQGQKTEKSGENEEPESASNLAEAEKKKLISEAMQISEGSSRILCYKNKAPAAPESHQNPLKVIYSLKTPTSQSGTRYISTSSDRILDAPDIINDYYLNLMDWSTDNIVTVALGSSVYMWNAETGNIERLVDYEDGGHACALSWIPEGQILAIGTNLGSVELWDCSRLKRLRVMEGHSARVGTLAWNSHLVSSGSRDGSIIHHDVRARENEVLTLTGHTQEVCGLKWSTDFKYLSSGGNDNLVNVWPETSGGVGTLNTPLHVFNQHQAAVRALAWSPWQKNILATGGGTADRCIKFWNVNNGNLVNSIDTKSQVCALLWSVTYKEIISAHGFANNQLTIWKYPSMIKQAELTGHTSRVLQMAMSPDGSTVISAGADETLRLWSCFAPDPKAAKKTKISDKVQGSGFRQSIR